MGEVAIVAAEAGGGKTSLVRRFAASEGAAVWWGSCDNLRAPRPLGPLADIAAAAGGPLAAAMAGGAPRADVFRATMEVLLAAAPVVVVIEDLHWADDATLDLVTYLGRRIRDVPALLVITHRNDEMGATHPSRAALAEVAGNVATRRHLAPLSVGAVGRLAADESIDAATIHRHTAGNPFFVTEVLAAGGALAPPSIVEAVLGRASRLPPDARRALDAAAIAPGHVELRLLDELLDELTVGPGDVDHCTSSGMLVEVDGGVAFRHELARLAVVDAMPPTRRRALHQRALKALERWPTSDTARLAHHAEEAQDGTATLRYSPLAARAANAVGAHRAAAAHLESALRFADQLEIGEQVVLRHELAHELQLVGRLDDSVAAHRAAIEGCRAMGNGRREGQLLVAMAAALVLAGRQAEADAAVRAATALLEPLPPGPELVSALTAMTSMHMLARELDEAASWGARAIALATELGDDRGLSLALIQDGVAVLMGGEHDGGMERLRSGMAIGGHHGWDDRVVFGLTQLGSGAGEVRRYDVAVPALIDGIALAERHELTASELYMTAWLARCDLELGRWDDAGARATRLLARPGCTGISRMTALTVLGRLRARRGDPAVWEAARRRAASWPARPAICSGCGLWRRRGPKPRGWRIAWPARRMCSRRSG